MKLKLRTDAEERKLATLLNENIESRRLFQTLQSPGIVVPGAPPIPARTAAMNNRARALAWDTRGVHGNTDVYRNTLDSKYSLLDLNPKLEQTWSTG